MKEFSYSVEKYKHNSFKLFVEGKEKFIFMMTGRGFKIYNRDQC